MKPPDNIRYLLFGGTFVLANKLQAVADKQVSGLSTKQWFLLRNIMDMPSAPPPTITQITRTMDSTRQNITKMLASLAKEGFVVIESSNLDSRSRSVRITAAGLAAASEAAANAQGFLTRLFADINPADLDAAGEVLLAMVRNLEKMQPE